VSDDERGVGYRLILTPGEVEASTTRMMTKAEIRWFFR
jgi:hypothetical protein